MFIEPQIHASGSVIVDWAMNFVHWLAWREWLHGATGKTSFPQKLTCMFPWPPTSGEGVLAVLDQLRQTREIIDKEKGAKSGVLKAVPNFAQPWHEWSSSLKREIAQAETARRQDWDGLFGHAPPYPWSIRNGLRFEEPAHYGTPPIPAMQSKPRYVPRYVPGTAETPTLQRDTRPISDELRAVIAAQKKNRELDHARWHGKDTA